MTFTTFISTNELAAIIDKPNVLIVDCRFELADPDSGQEMYLTDHIPGAVYCDLNQQMSSKMTPTSSRHPLPDKSSFQQLLSSWGVQPSVQVVVYDAEGGAMAAGRLWWMLKGCGHNAIAILDGGYPKWLVEDRPTESTLPAPRKTTNNNYEIDPTFSLSSKQVEKIHTDPDWLLIDARNPQRFAGFEEVIDPIAGHIPNAINLPYAQLLDPTLKLLPVNILKEKFNSLFGNRSINQLGIYCGSGVTSILVLAAMEYCGFHGSKLYVGSWSEWIRESKHEIAAGIHPEMF